MFVILSRKIFDSKRQNHVIIGLTCKLSTICNPFERRVYNAICYQYFNKISVVQKTAIFVTQFCKYRCLLKKLFLSKCISACLSLVVSIWFICKSLKPIWIHKKNDQPNLIFRLFSCQKMKIIKFSDLCSNKNEHKQQTGLWYFQAEKVRCGGKATKGRSVCGKRRENCWVKL